MEDRLPNITIKVNVLPNIFIERLGKLISEQEIWRIKNKAIQITSVSLLLELAKQPKLISIPSDTMVHFGYFPELDGEKMRIQFVSANWPDGTPTYDYYVSVASLIKPLLSLYNKQHKTTIKLNIQSKKSLVPKLSPLLSGYFTRFVSLSNKGALHPTDWGLFYDFIYASHQLKCKLHESDIEYLLTEAGFSADYASDISEVYRHGRALLKNGCPPTTWSIIELHRKWEEERARDRDKHNS